MAPPQIPALSPALLSARESLQKDISAHTSSFAWLQTLHVFNHPDCDIPSLTRTIHVTPSGGLSICTNDLFSGLFYEPTLLFGTVKSWIIPVITFPVLNPERCRRFVSAVLLSSNIITCYFSWCTLLPLYWT